MKTASANSLFGWALCRHLRLPWILVVVTRCFGILIGAEEGGASASPAEMLRHSTFGPASAISVNTNSASSQNRTVDLPTDDTDSSFVNAVIRLADAGVSIPVIVTFIECSKSAEPLTAADLIALKQHNVADEIVTLLLTQTAKARALAVQRKQEAVARALAARNARTGGIDPESYEYFQHHYLQPRAMSSGYHRISPSFGIRGSYRSGPSSSLNFRRYDRGRLHR